MSDATDKLVEAVRPILEYLDSALMCGNDLSGLAEPLRRALASYEQAQGDWLPAGEVPDKPDDRALHWSLDVSTTWAEPEPEWIGPSNRPCKHKRWSRRPITPPPPPNEEPTDE